jgi:hypothetical protein
MIWEVAMCPSLSHLWWMMRQTIGHGLDAPSFIHNLVNSSIRYYPDAKYPSLDTVNRT